MRIFEVPENEMTAWRLAEGQSTEQVMEIATVSADQDERPSGMASSGNGFLWSHWHFVQDDKNGNYWQHVTGKIIRSSKN